MMHFEFSLDRCDLDSTDAFACLYSNLDVSVVAPGAAQRVLHQEVLKAALTAVAHDERSVVNLTPTAFISENTACVVQVYH